jgi:CRISPR-associated endonuclease/helicase Cas3
LLAAFARGCEEQNTPQADSGDYPLITAYSRETGLTETAIEATPQRRCSVAVRLIPEQNEVERLIVEAARQGRCVCWIRNTVHDALTGCERLKKQMDAEKLMLFHARFAMGDRLEIENTVVETFGRRSGEQERNGKVLVATQVVEQSLDLDFDLLVSDLAPMDLLIQRAGRLHRHPRDERGNHLPEGPDRRSLPEMIIHGPLPQENVSGDWYKSAFPKASFVYPSHGCLWLTARLLQGKTMKMPDDARELIEAAFSEHADSIPEPLRQRDQNADAQYQADRSLAHINMLKLEEGYTGLLTSGARI